jgi:hypothetical protein
MNTKISYHSLLGFGVATLLAAPVVLAQMGSGQARQMPKYDPATEVTVKGTIEEVEEGMMQPGHMQQMGSMGQTGHMGQMGHMGLHLVLKTESASYTVLVGPAQYVKDKGFTFAKGDTIQVTGSKVKYGDGEALIAREITKGDKVLTLRNQQGIPAWSRGPRS